MKKILLSILLSAGILVNGWAEKNDEGMWLPILLSQKNYGDMVAHGLKLTPEQLYSVNNASVKDAVVWFGGGCTGEVVSNEGLLITNHHCGYDAIAGLSSVSSNYLRDGFWAKSKDQELASPGLSVQFLVKMEDVTTEVMAALKDIPFEQWQAKLPEILKPITKKATDGTNYEAFVREMFKANQFYLFVMEKFTDIRLVGTPTESIGKFGGDTDNWMWPRHTGDFSMFRIYAGKDNKPAPYSKDNVPYKPKHFLPISLKGIKDGDFSMIFGFPGRTNRYETSYGVQMAIEETNPAIVKLRDKRLNIMKAEMNKDMAVRLQQASRYAQIANYWKYFIGQTEQLKRNKVWDRKTNDEATFTKWASGKAEYQNIFTNLDQSYKTFRPYNKHGVYLREGVLATPMMSYAAAYLDLQKILSKDTVDPKALAGAIEMIKARQSGFLKIYNKEIDKNILASMLDAYYSDVEISQHPEYMAEILKSKGKTNSEKFMSFAEKVYNKSILTDTTATGKFLRNPSLKMLDKDPAIKCALAFLKNYNERFKPFADNFNMAITKEGKAYVKGLMEMSPSRNFYPDANSTMRCTYGNVKSYNPKDAIHYTYFTTLKGVIEKAVPGDAEFDIPEKLTQLYNNKDFGQYADATGNVPVGFITTNDITGGNSGSPVINADGQLIGTAFDGNWEAMSGDIAFDEQYKRTICVDVRYLLFIVDKFGGATNLINEMTIVK
jgi:hypothetical protein